MLKLKLRKSKLKKKISYYWMTLSRKSLVIFFWKNFPSDLAEQAWDFF